MKRGPTHQRRRPSGHGMLFIASALVFGTVFAIARGTTPQAGLSTAMPVPIGIEHAAPVTVSLSLGIDGDRGIVDIRQEGDEPIHVSLPDTWPIRETRGGPLSDAERSQPSAGYVRWIIRPGITLSFSVAKPGPIAVQNASKTPLLIRHARVDVRTGRTMSDTVLVTEREAVIWR